MGGRGGDAATPRDPGGGRLDGAHALWLLAAFLLLAALYLEPATGFAYFGSDTGEYYRLTVDLASTGHLPVGGTYPGWGIGYPDFPGLFVLGAGTAGATGVDPLTALMATVPVLAAFSVAPLFLLFRRILPNDSVALLGAAFAGVVMPRAFSLAHPAPLAIGDLLVVAGLWMFVEGRTDARWYLPLALTAGAIIVTHHLSSYFLLVTALGGLVLLELVRPRAWSVRFPIRELAFLAGFAIVLDAFWFARAPDFVGDVIGTSKLLGLGADAIGAGVGLGALVVAVGAGLLIRWRRGSRIRGLRVSFPSDGSVGRDALLLAVGIFGGVAVLLTVPLPGTRQTTTPAAIGYFLPILLLVPLVSGTRRLVSTARIGPYALLGLFVLGLSAIFGIVTDSPVILPARHAEYLLIFLGLLAGLSVVRWAARIGETFGRPGAGAVVAAALLLVAANAAIAYPPAPDLGGFQEGLTVRDALLAEWSAGGLPAGTVVASDHRLSSYLFGVDGDRATWDSTPDLFCGTHESAAERELAGAGAPNGRYALDAIAVDGTMRYVGVALDPSAEASPISPNASAWLAGPGFVPIYENQAETVYWVDSATLPAP
ncbi:MAG TPA: hypothetical protein VMH90_03465 [Thermoplasmata archaeon]|nr:hypothetical protein [Thermoplasmata archaeon]